jgi:hypothetical protein
LGAFAADELMSAQIKRVTIAEAIMGTAVIAAAQRLISAGVVSVLLLDDYTKFAPSPHSTTISYHVCRGLDSLVSLQIIKTLRVVSRAFGATVIAAQNQVCAWSRSRVSEHVYAAQPGDL